MRGESAMSALILASTSRYRRELLGRLGMPFEVEAPAIDETPRPGEAPLALVQRLAAGKAEAIARHHPDAWVIGSDQLAFHDNEILGKPGTAARCIAQLTAVSGRSVTFLTAVCLLRHRDQTSHSTVDSTVVRFRVNAPERIRRYVEREQPFDCAGGFKCEGLGITLFERIDSTDPTALIGLPLIWVAGALALAGLDPLGGDREASAQRG
jgi:septum formation protein